MPAPIRWGASIILLIRWCINNIANNIANKVFINNFFNLYYNILYYNENLHT